MVSEWPEGHRHVHHGLEAERSRREQALQFRAHHTEDQHTQEGDYAAIDEAFTRLDSLERPTTERRLARLRALAAARVIRRRYNQEANWLVHNGEHLHYGRHHRLHTLYPDQYAHPDKDGLVLRDEDKARIGPTADDIDIECDNRIDDLRPRLSEILAFREAAKPFPGEADHISLLFTGRVAAIGRERQRARFLRALGVVADDYFEPHYWTTSKGEELRAHAREALLGAPGEDDPWHAVAEAAMHATSEHEDLLAVCVAVRRARRNVTSHPVWTDPPTIPDVSVVVSNFQVTLSWTGSMPTGVSVQTIIVPTGDMVVDTPLEFTVAESPKTYSVGGGRVAVLVQFQRNNMRTVGSIEYTGALV